jgi:cell division protein FtsW (lipid II flippase)
VLKLQQCAKFTEYLKTVCAQIRWEKSHNVISKELLNHLEDQKNAFLSDGLSENEAEQKAIDEMGNPVQIGTDLDRAYRPKTEWGLLLFTAFLLVAGIFARSLLADTDSSSFSILNVALGLFAGLVALVIAYFIDFSVISKYIKHIYIGFILLFIALLILSPRINGKVSYASYLLLLFPLIFSGIVYHMRDKKAVGIVLCGLSIAIPLVLGLQIPSLPGVFISAISGIVILTYALSKNWFGMNKTRGFIIVYIPFLSITGIVIGFAIRGSARRLGIIFNPTIDPNGAGYVGIVIRKVLGNASVIGKGSAAQDMPPLPNTHSEYLLTFLINQVGWISFVLIVLLLVLLILRGISICRKQKSSLGQLACISIIASFSLQCFCYIANNLGVSLFDEFPLPLISGNISMIINLFLIGALLSVFRNGCLMIDKKSTSKQTKLFEISDGKLVIYLRS